MARKSLVVETRSDAPPETVFAVLADTEGWVRWSKKTKSAVLEQPGATDREGVGAVRAFQNGRTLSREEVLEYDPPRRFVYTLLSGLPLREYRSEVDLTPDGTGTRIRWSSSFEPERPGTGWLYRFALRVFIRRTARSLAEFAATRSSGQPPSG
jgi:uncharacterized protein YndB with AHSA1/START domain